MLDGIVDRYDGSEYILCDEVLIVSDTGRLMAGGRSPCCPYLVFYLVDGWVQISITPGWRRALMDILRQVICRRTPYTACFVIGGPSVLISRQRAREDQVGIDLPILHRWNGPSDRHRG